VHRNPRLCRRGRSYAAFALLLLLPGIGFAQVAGQHGAAPDSTPGNTREQRAARALEAARGNPLALREYLVRMPKGADLHNHLSGAVYAESWIRAAAEDGLCVTVASPSFSKLPAAVDSGAGERTCGNGKVPASQAYKDQHLFDALVDAFSMRGFVASAGVTGHDHFFDTFAKFSGTDARHTGEWLDEVANRAARQNEQYLELMVTPPYSKTTDLVKQMVWQEDFGRMRDALLAGGLRDDLKAAHDFFDQAEAVRQEREHCGASDAAPACRVEIRYIYQVSRGAAKEKVFAQTVLGFEVAASDSRMVAINYVQPEDGYTSMTDYALHMRIVGFLRGAYPQVHVSLHAGELAPGLAPFEGLCCHVRLAVEQAHAERIGHGVDVMYEDRPYELLKEMAAKHVLVEINLTSNDLILGISGKDHPLPLYRKAGVPVALSTDDEGVSRIDLTHEYVRAVETYELHYGDLKQMVRAGLAHSFLPGESLWRDGDSYVRAAEACSKDAIGGDRPSAGCAAFLNSSAKAKQQWELERRFRVFEAGF